MNTSTYEMFPSLLQGITYPIAKENIIEVAKSNGAPDDVVEVFNGMPNGTYLCLLDVVQEIEEIEYEEEEMAAQQFFL